MSTFRELLEMVKDEGLTLPLLEKYRDELVHLHSSMQLQLAELEKKEAFFFVDKEGDESDVSRKRAWRATEEGQRSLELNRFIKACVKEIDSLKSRIYSQL
jgi:hypothetical protein